LFDLRALITFCWFLDLLSVAGVAIPIERRDTPPIEFNMTFLVKLLLTVIASEFGSEISVQYLQVLASSFLPSSSGSSSHIVVSVALAHVPPTTL